MVDEPAELERRLDAGEWLRPGEVAVLLDIGRSTVHDMLKAGKISYRRKGGGIQRLCDPADVRRLLDESRRVRRAGDDDA